MLQEGRSKTTRLLADTSLAPALSLTPSSLISQNPSGSPSKRGKSEGLVLNQSGTSIAPSSNSIVASPSSIAPSSISTHDNTHGWNADETVYRNFAFENMLKKGPDAGPGPLKGGGSKGGPKGGPEGGFKGGSKGGQKGGSTDGSEYTYYAPGPINSNAFSPCPPGTAYFPNGFGYRNRRLNGQITKGSKPSRNDNRKLFYSSMCISAASIGIWKQVSYTVFSLIPLVKADRRGTASLPAMTGVCVQIPVPVFPPPPVPLPPPPILPVQPPTKAPVTRPISSSTLPPGPAVFSQIYSSYIVSNTANLKAADLLGSPYLPALNSAYGNFVGVELEAYKKNMNRALHASSNQQRRLQSVTLELVAATPSNYVIRDTRCPWTDAILGSCQVLYATFLVRSQGISNISDVEKKLTDQIQSDVPRLPGGLQNWIFTKVLPLTVISAHEPVIPTPLTPTMPPSSAPFEQPMATSTMRPRTKPITPLAPASAPTTRPATPFVAKPRHPSTSRPTVASIVQPTRASLKPAISVTVIPTNINTRGPTSATIVKPSNRKTVKPTSATILKPTKRKTRNPTKINTKSPAAVPSRSHRPIPSMLSRPSKHPTFSNITVPTKIVNHTVSNSTNATTGRRPTRSLAPSSNLSPSISAVPSIGGTPSLGSAAPSTFNAVPTIRLAPSSHSRSPSNASNGTHVHAKTTSLQSSSTSPVMMGSVSAGIGVLLLLLALYVSRKTKKNRSNDTKGYKTVEDDVTLTDRDHSSTDSLNEADVIYLNELMDDSQEDADMIYLREGEDESPSEWEVARQAIIEVSESNEGCSNADGQNWI
jgi:hypothetical protein